MASIGSYCRWEWSSAVKPAVSPPAEKPRMPIRCGSTSCCAAWLRNRLTARCASCTAASQRFSGFRDGTRYLRTTPVTPIVFNHCATSRAFVIERQDVMATSGTDDHGGARVRFLRRAKDRQGGIRDVRQLDDLSAADQRIIGLKHILLRWQLLRFARWCAWPELHHFGICGGSDLRQSQEQQAAECFRDETTNPIWSGAHFKLFDWDDRGPLRRRRSARRGLNWLYYTKAVVQVWSGAKSSVGQAAPS